MTDYDQTSWQRDTTWEGAMPSEADFWRLITAKDLPIAFRDAVTDHAGRGPRTGLLRRCSAAASQLLGTGTGAAVERASWKIRFANLVSGRFTELVFERTYRKLLEEAGLDFTEETTLRNWIDYRLQADKFDLGINVKNAGVQYRESARWVGLEPPDTLPIATYKIFGSERGEVPVVYVYLVDWTLLSRLRRSYLDQLSTSERTALTLLASTKQVPRNVEDAFIECTIGERLPQLLKAVGYGDAEPPFHAISAARCRQIFFENHDRSPYVFRQRMNTDPNVHVSVIGDTLPFGAFSEQFLATPDRRRALVEGLAQTKTVVVPNPPV